MPIDVMNTLLLEITANKVDALETLLFGILGLMRQSGRSVLEIPEVDALIDTYHEATKTTQDPHR